MKKGKIIILVVLVAIITSIITFLIINGASTMSEKKKIEEILDSKKVINNWILEKSDYITITFKELINNENEEEKMKGIATLILEIDEMKEEINNLNWCKTNTLVYNNDCIVYKEEVKKFISIYRDLLAMSVIADIEPENKENEEMLLIFVGSIGEKNETFLKKTDEFMDKKYY
jgi:hypothetical protein